MLCRLATHRLWCVAIVLILAAGPSRVLAQGTSRPVIEDEAKDSAKGTEAPAAKTVLPSLKTWIDQYEEVAAARDLFEEGKVDEATEQLKVAKKAHADLPAAEIVLADLYSAVGNSAAAMASLDTAAIEHPEDPEAFLVLGMVALRQNQRTAAALLLERGAALMKTFPADAKTKQRNEIRYRAGKASRAMRFEKWAEAIEHFSRWVTLDPENVQPRIELARALFRAKQGKKAMEQLKQVWGLDDRLPVPEIAIAGFYTESEDLDQAKKWLAKAAKVHADRLTAQWRLAEWYWKHGDAEGAKRHAMRAVAIDAEDKSAALLAGIVSHYDGDLDAAEMYLTAAQKVAPNDLIVRNHLAMLLASQDNNAKLIRARALAESTLRSAARSAEAAATLAWIQLQMGYTNASVKNYQAAYSSRVRTPDMLYMFARFFEKNGKNVEAAARLDEALGTDALFVFRRDAKALQLQIQNSLPAKETKPSNAP